MTANADFAVDDGQPVGVELLLAGAQFVQGNVDGSVKTSPRELLRTAYINELGRSYWHLCTWA